MLLGIATAQEPVSDTPASSILVTPLPDGISITGGEPLRQVVATWDIFVTLDPPPFPVELEQQVRELGFAIAGVEALKDRGINLNVAPQRLRRLRLRAILNEGTGRTRARRGLMDVGGSILHALFGVATSAQLGRFQAALNEIGAQQMRIAHAHNSLATIVNQTKYYLGQMAIQQQQLTAQVSRISGAIQKIVKQVDSQERRINQLELVANLDRYIDTLELAARQYVAQIALFHRQRAELEVGRLTRDLLSEDQLVEILSQATTQNKVIQSKEWFYQYIEVTPLWQDGKSLLYKVELPLIAPRPYLMYQILTHPVPISNSTYTVHVLLQPSYAIDTVSGNLFVPSRCIGHDPTVCRTGPEYGPSLMRCPRGLITNRPELINTCRVAIKDYTGESLVTMIDLNQYAIASRGESLTVRCSGHTEQHVNVPRGAHNITCLRPCTIVGAGWTITCIDRLYLARRYVMPAVQVTAHFNFSGS